MSLALYGGASLLPVLWVRFDQVLFLGLGAPINPRSIHDQSTICQLKQQSIPFLASLLFLTLSSLEIV